MSRLALLALILLACKGDESPPVPVPVPAPDPRAACDHSTDGLACLRGGLAASSSPSSADAEALFRRGCELGNGESCTLLGGAALRRAPLADLAGAAQSFERGCAAGDPKGCRALGLAYLAGAGVPEGRPAATIWLGKACDGGDLEGCHQLALVLLVGGPGLAPQPEIARQALGKACEGKLVAACERMVALGWARRGASPSP